MPIATATESSFVSWKRNREVKISPFFLRHAGTMPWMNPFSERVGRLSSSDADHRVATRPGIPHPLHPPAHSKAADSHRHNRGGPPAGAPPTTSGNNACCHQPLESDTIDPQLTRPSGRGCVMQQCCRNRLSRVVIVYWFISMSAWTNATALLVHELLASRSAQLIGWYLHKNKRLFSLHFPHVSSPTILRLNLIPVPQF